MTAAPAWLRPMDLVGVAEMARMMGVARQRVHELTRTHADFPEPVAELAAGRIWRRQDVEQWMASRKRPEKEVHVREIAGVSVVSPVGYADMEVVGDAVRAVRPVAVELRRLDQAQVRRCIDFMAGAGYVTAGSVERIADRVYLVSPSGTSVTAAQREQIVAALG